MWYTELKNFIKSIPEWPAHIGQLPKFWLFMAHSMTAASITLGIRGNFGGVLILLLVILFKEFWYDVNYETNPSQDYEAGLEDLSQWCIGIIAALLWIHLVWA